MIEIFHNTRCKKSREGLEILKHSGKEYEIREYLKNPPGRKEIESLLQKLNMKPIQIVRQNEKLWKEKFKEKDLDDGELIRILSENPILIERPIVINKDAAVIGRPPSQIEKIL